MSTGHSKEAASALKWRGAQQIAVKLIFLVRTPVLARLLAPDDFGLLAIGLVSLDIMMRLTEVGMVPALVQREDLERKHYDVAWNVGFLRATAVAVAVFLAAPYIAATFGDLRATPLIRALGLRPVLLAGASIGVASLTRKLRFKPLAILDLSDTTTDAIVSIALAPVIGVWALVAGALSGPLVRIVVSYVLAPHAPRPTLDRQAAAALIRFGRWIFLTGVIGLAGRFVLQAAISRQLGTAELGLYYVSAKIAYATTEISEGLIGVVAFPWFSRLQANRIEAQRTFHGVLSGVAIVLIPIGFMLAALASSIVHDVLGSQWSGAAPVIQVMVVASLIGAFGDAALPLLKGVGRPHKVALLTLIQNGLLAALVWSAAGRFGLVGAAGAWIPATFATQLVAHRMVRAVLDAPLSGAMKHTAVVAGASAFGAALAWAIDGAVGGLPGLLVGSASGGLAIGALLLGADRRWTLGILDALWSLSPRLGQLATRMSNTLFAART